MGRLIADIDNIINQEKNISYIENVKFEDIPWRRMTTAYSRSSVLIEDFNKLFNMNQSSMEDIKEALSTIESNIEHQSTLWHSTPYAMIFLARIFKQALQNNIEENEKAFYIVKELLSFFQVIADLFVDIGDLSEEKPFQFISEMVKEENLMSPDSEEEDYEEMDEVFFYSLYYYSYLIIKTCKTEIENINNPKLIEYKEDLLKNLNKSL